MASTAQGLVTRSTRKLLRLRGRLLRPSWQYPSIAFSTLGPDDWPEFPDIGTDAQHHMMTGRSATKVLMARWRDGYPRPPVSGARLMPCSAADGEREGKATTRVST